jgi:hypothetical protein
MNSKWFLLVLSKNYLPSRDSLSYRKIVNIISEESFNVSTAGVFEFWKKYEETGIHGKEAGEWSDVQADEQD